MTERELVLALKSARAKVDTLTAELDAAKKAYDQIEHNVIEHLTMTGAESTATYDGIGYAKMMKPRVYASVNKDNEPALKTWLREHHREDLIREVVHPQSLSGMVGEMLEAGKTPPECVSYYLKQNVRTY